MFDNFRFPHTVSYLLRKEGRQSALDFAIKTAKCVVDRNQASDFINYVARSPQFMKDKADV